MSNVTVSNPTKAQNVAKTSVTPQFFFFLAQIIKPKVPDLKHFKQVVQEEKWRKAMNEELEALESHDTWEITELPYGKQAIGCKCLYRTKYHSDRRFDINKTCLYWEIGRGMELTMKRHLLL